MNFNLFVLVCPSLRFRVNATDMLKFNIGRI